MPEMMPETLGPDDLRRLADLLERPTRYGATTARDGMRACASAWEAQIVMHNDFAESAAYTDGVLRARIEALEGEAAGRALMDAEGEAFLPEVVKQLQARIEALEKLVREARIFICGEKLLAEWVAEAPDWELRAIAALRSEEETDD